MFSWLLRIAAVAVLTMIGLEAFDIHQFASMLSRQRDNLDLLPALRWRRIASFVVFVICLLSAVEIAEGMIRRLLPRRKGSIWHFGTWWPHSLTRVLLGAVAACVLLWNWHEVPPNRQAHETSGQPLMGVKNWYYHLGKIDVARIEKSDADLLVIDFARNDGLIPLTRAEVGRVSIRPDGRKRPVIAYLSVGEAEGYRYYWKPEWARNKPSWHLAENCAWPRNHIVRFWHEDWKRIMFSGPDSYLKRIIDAGFDGVYLDRVDVYGELRKERPSARADMINFVSELAQTARALKPGFLIIPQNAEDLLRDRRYRKLIDGLGKEDLLYGQDATGKRNSFWRIWRSSRLIRKLQWDYKPVFAVEYLPTKPAITDARREMRSLNLVPTFAHRDLDGFDPTMARPPSQELYGTPEWIAKECDAKGKRHW